MAANFALRRVGMAAAREIKTQYQSAERLPGMRGHREDFLSAPTLPAAIRGPAAPPPRSQPSCRTRRKVPPPA
jgi:hypothetical protein